MRLVIYSFFLALCFFSFVQCNSKNKNSIPVLEINPKKSSINCFLSKIANDTEIVLLETNMHSIIGPMPDLIHIDEKNIIFRSKKTILIFDRKGNFSNKINAVGNGPHEYNAIMSIHVDPVNEYLYISDYESIKVFNYKGKFIEKINLTFPPAGICKNNEGYFFVPQKQMYEEENRTMLAVFDSTFTKVKSFKSRNNVSYSNLKQALFYVGKPYLMNNKVFYKEPFIDTIYQVTKNELIPHWNISLGDYEMSTKDAVSIIGGNKLRTKIRPIGISETSNYFFISYDYDNAMYKGLFTKDENKFIYHQKFTEDDYLNNKKNSFGIKNDLINEFPSFWPKYIDKECIVDFVSPIDLTENKRNELKCKEDDNPILIIAKLR
ncbi:6-bladed beta-propeller [Flavivirga eckloniae]|uniref:6-bladed beta-propeller n=1 Tax=Flavivirga eckloniae TaxID=1803846 RepID=A0A2K9PN85_9FLAO|nr:6-bladed beta-propeller [Flavivirga eckloniae]AUP78495.1 hypothetical protein C1H87_07135 [Flavivirga eckloniae]